MKNLEKILKKNVSEYKELEESDFEESDFEESQEFKKFDEEIRKKYNIDKDTKTKYDSYGFDKDGKHKDTYIFLNKKNINSLKNKDDFLKLYNEIIKNGEFSENINKSNISSYEFKKIMENILNGKIDDNKVIKK